MSTTATLISFIESNKGRKQPARNNNTRKFNKKTSSKIYWVCKEKSCTAKVHTDLDYNYLYAHGDHSHLLEPEIVEVQHFCGVLKARAVNETIPTCKIYDEEIVKGQFSSQTLVNISMFREIRETCSLYISKIPRWFRTWIESSETKTHTGSSYLHHIWYLRRLSDRVLWWQSLGYRHNYLSKKNGC